MKKIIKLGIITCGRYRSCAGGKCLRALRERHGAFSVYGDDEELELVGFADCGGCPGGNIEYAPEEMKKNGAEVIHLATGLLVGYPPCPYLDYFRSFIQKRFNLKIVMGTHPIPAKYLETHEKLRSWEAPEWKEILAPVMSDKEIRIHYD